jgi:uncharacterized protein (DUF983 family)
MEPIKTGKKCSCGGDIKEYKLLDGLTKEIIKVYHMCSECGLDWKQFDPFKK